MAERNELRTWSFLSLLIGGLLIVVGGLMGALMMSAWAWAGMMPMMGPMGYTGIGLSAIMAWWMGAVGLATGGLVLAAAYQVYHERDIGVWGVVAIVAGAVSLLAMGGYVIGAVAAIAGGALALVERQQRAPRAKGA